jgi:hypothetical protein
MAKFIEHGKLRPGGPEIFDPSVISPTHTGWRKIGTIPMPHGTGGKLIVWFVDGGATIKAPDYRWPCK